MLGLKLLLTQAATTLDQLCLARMSQDIGILTPEYLDPLLVLAAEGAPGAAEAKLRHSLAAIAAQLLVVGAAASVRAILDHQEQGRRQVALLALAGAAAWQVAAQLPQGGQVHRRLAADGQVYLLAGTPTAAAAHAPHAMRGYAERLWIVPAGHPCADGRALPTEPPCRISGTGPDSLSLDAALRDLLLRLSRTGEAALLDAVAALPPDPLLPIAPAGFVPLAPAAAA